MKRLLVFALLLIVAFMGWAEGAQESGDDSTMVAFLLPTRELPIWLAQGEQLEATFDEAGYETKVEFAEGVVERQVSQIENAMLQGADYLVIAGVDPFALSGAVERAKEQGATVIANDRLIMNTEAVDYYVTFDLFRLGEMQGQFIEEELGLDDGEEGPFTMEIVSGSPDDPNAQVFYDGQMSVLRPYIEEGVLNVKSGQVAFRDTATPKWESSAAQARMENVLGAYYSDDVLDVVLAANDSTALGTISALKSLGYGSDSRPFPIITGQDSELTAVKSILRGEQSMTVFLDAKELSERVLDVVNALEDGDQPETSTTFDNEVKEVPTVLYEPVIVTEDNWEIVIERGLYSEEDFEDVQ
jgi:putative multiple sugar transport system substrate-binding protein